MKRSQNLLLLIAVLALAALPLWLVQKPAAGPEGKEVARFRGTDDQAKDLVNAIAPGYKPWFKPLLEPPGNETGSLLFALQAALGAGFIGYYLVVAKKRAKLTNVPDKAAKC